MILLGLTLLFLLQVEGIRRKTFLYHRPGVEALLPCLSDLPYGTKCSFITWLNNKGRRITTADVERGVINQDSVRAARLRLHSNCSLIINNVTAEDVGRYTCRLNGSNTWDTRVYLNILTISSSPPDPKRDEEVTLTCTLWRHHYLLCEDGSIRWINETGSVLDGAGDGFRFDGQTNCVSHLAVKHQSEHSRRFTCQYVEDSSVKIEDHYRTLITGRGETSLYHRPGVEALLPCLSVSAYETRCSDVNWLNNKGGRTTTFDVINGEINQESVRAAWLRLHSNCSLTINITAEDAGFYTCRLHETNAWDTRVYLNILTISSSPSDPKRDEEVTLTCTLWRHHYLLCEDGSIRWINETGSVLDGAGDGFRFLRQTGCVSYLAVKHQSEHSRRFTCQYVEDSSVKIEDHYRILSTEPSSGASGWTPLSYVMLSLRISLLVVMMVITVMVVRYPGGGKQLKPSRVRFRGNDDVQEVEYQNTGESSADSTRR